MPNKKTLFALLGLLILFDLLWLWYMYTGPLEPRSTEEIHFVIQTGESGEQIARRLHEEGLIRVPVLFRGYTFLGGIYGNLRAGEYILSPSMRMPEIALHLANGNFIDRELRVLEGWSLKNIAADLEAQGLFSQEQFFHTVGMPGVDYRENNSVPMPHDFADEFPFLQEKPDYVSLEGYLFPDTYRIAKGDTSEDIVRRVLRNFQQKITPEILAEIEAQEKTLFEVLTMASLIEKEVRSYQDKQLVSGILWKRLENDMRLQVDATLVYVRPENYYIVTIDDTFVESSYNTYRNEGLPPGPISNPGLDSIKAALYPKESPYWFYSSPSINTTIFSETFEEHRAKADLYVR